MPRAVDDDLTLGDLAASQTLDALQPEALACFVARADALLECLLCLRTCPLHPDARLSWDAHADAVPRCLRLRDAPLQSNTTRHTVDRRPPEYERASRRVGNGAPCVADGFPAKNPIGVPKLVDRRSRPDDVTTASARLPIRDVRVTG